MSIKVIKTRDGSTSLLVTEMNETYHSTHGAVTEAEYVFIKEGLEHYQSLHDKSTVNILEIGFGTGLNALVTLLHTAPSKFKVNYHSLETLPLPPETIEGLNYADIIDKPDTHHWFKAIHDCEWNIPMEIHESFTLKKIQQSVHEFQGEQSQYDIVYFDAFAPSRQPDMWALEVFQKLNAMVSPGGILTTYCAQGQFKRDLKTSGFEVASLPGPPGKKEMTRGTKPQL